MPTPAQSILLFGGQLPTLDINFVTGKYRLGTQTVSSFLAMPGVSFTRASTKTALNSAGAVVSFASGVPAITDLGFLPEESRTNSFLNSAVGVTQAVTTTAASWTLSFWGTGSITLSGGATGTLNGTGVNNRVTLTVTATAASTTLTVSGSTTNVQFEAGAFATSVIVTTSAAVTRAVDVDNISGLGGTLGQAFTLVATGNAPVAQTGSTSSILASVSDGTVNNRAYLDLEDTFNRRGAIVISGGSSLLNQLPAYTPPALTKAALRVDAALGYKAAFNGTLTSGGTGTLPAGMTSMSIGKPNWGGGSLFNGYIQRVILYPAGLSDAQLQALTQ